MVKKFSRKDAKAQSGVTQRRTRFAPLHLCGKILCALLVLLSLCSPGLTQKKAARFDPDGSFWLHESTPPPTEFSDFGGIDLNARKVRHLPSAGLRLINGTTFRFKTLNVKQNNFTFTTVAVKGVSYSFSGRFLKGGVYSSGILDDETPVLEGTLTKFRNGEKRAEAKLKFVYFGGT
ncbi:MAG TPA: hypothetical protein VJT69_17845 [Pyrinomonadaceae bacterium]|nr:hypothetical protein [Pyrinomonadaceae bacterium]